MQHIGLFNFCIGAVYLDIIKVYYSPTNAQVIVFKNNIKIYIKIAPTYLGAVTLSSGSSLSLQARIMSSLKMVRLHRNISELFLM